MPGVVQVVVFSNFEGWPHPKSAGAIVRWFDACARAHPEVRWTHLYNPAYLLIGREEIAATEKVFSPYLLDAQDAGRAEIGLHIHPFYDLIRAMGVDPIGTPFAGDPSDACDTPRSPGDDASGGYDVLMTGYAPEDRAAILDVSIGAFLCRGFRRPRTFCAGYSAADPPLQAMLARKRFTSSFAAQHVLPGQYGRCWHRLLEWSGRITPLTIPYRVSRHTILPPPHPPAEHLDLVEIPLNMGVDASDIGFEGGIVSRERMFDLHCDWTGEHGTKTAVAIGVHADQVRGEPWPDGPIARTLNGFLHHVSRRAQAGDVVIENATASEVAERFRENTAVGSVPHPE